LGRNIEPVLTESNDTRTLIFILIDLSLFFFFGMNHAPNRFDMIVVMILEMEFEPAAIFLWQQVTIVFFISIVSEPH
jgi:hypothetical protein